MDSQDTWISNHQLEGNLIATVFIVEDEELLLELYTAILTRAGHNVIGVAINGAEAILKLQQLKTPPHIIIMDHRMPIMDGLTATLELKRLLPSCKILFISADYRIEARTCKAGADLFITKPVELEKLLTAVHQLVGHS